MENFKKHLTTLEAKEKIEAHHPSYPGSQDSYHVGYIKDIGKMYQQTFIDTYTHVAFTKVYDKKELSYNSSDKFSPFYVFIKSTNR
ncbi:ISSod13, transposase [Francisella salina]|uniref:ISSod13, transposase n=1 Tax=Francisella salina TaxID=573569 RepID=A0ABM5MCF4_FRAST|nr:ISSod13, transposase [Francisella salina]